MLPDGLRATILGPWRCLQAPPAPREAFSWPLRARRPATRKQFSSGPSWCRRLRARMHGIRRALRTRCDRLRGRAARPTPKYREGTCALWRERQRGPAHQGAARRLARPLADVATSSAGRLYNAARCHFMARRRPDGTVGIAFTPALVVIAAQLAGALSWIALSAEDAPDFLTTAPLSRAVARTGQDRGDWPADRAHPRLAACRIGLRLALGRAMRASL